MEYIPAKMSSGNTNLVKKKFCEALLAKYDGMYREADAHLHFYMTHSVGIGEHSDLLEECDKFVKQMVDAKDNMNMLKKWMNENENENENKERVLGFVE